MRVISFGASTAQGAKDDTGGGFIGRLAEPVARMGAKVENHGIGGENTTQMLQRLGALGHLKKEDIVIVALGINDVPRNPDARPERRIALEKHRNNVGEILAFFQARTRCIYTSQYPVQYESLGLDPDMVAGYRNLGLSLAKDVGVDVVDIYGMIDAALFERFIHADGMHFNDKGHQFIADVLWKFIQDCDVSLGSF